MKKDEIKNTLKYTGAFVAWIMGSGFATGQEIFQFFSSFSYKSIIVVLINLAGFIIIGKTLMTEGYDNREIENFNHYEYFCGKLVGRIYTLIIPVTLIFLISVIISASGATLEQYYGVNRYIGSAVMAVLVLSAYLIGFERMVKIVSSIGPFIILFSVFVGVYTVARDYSSFSTVGNYTNELYTHRAAPNFVLSGILYVSLNFLCGSRYYIQLGRTAKSRKSAFRGAIFGAVLLILTILVLNIAMLLNAEDTINLSVPTLFLARRISVFFGGVFSVVLILGIFSSCSTMVWSFCSGFFKDDVKKNRIFSFITVIVCLALGFFEFSKLVSIVYPAIGYLGIFFIVCVGARGLKRKKKEKKTQTQAEELRRSSN